MEFIAAKDLPVTEAAEVDVLCVESGEMKRKPANGLGGGGATATVLFGSTFDGESVDLDVTSLAFADGHSPTAQEIYEAFLSGSLLIRMNSVSGAKFTTGLVIAVKPYGDYIKCYHISEHGTVINFDYSGEIVE